MAVKRQNSFWGILILLFILVGIPSLAVKHGTTTNSSSSREKSSQKNTYEMTSCVVDNAGVFSESQKSSLVSYLENLNSSTGVQIGVLVVKSMHGEDIESFSMRHAELWKLGQKGVDNGVLLTVAMEEHDVRIETGYGSESAITDAKCARIIRNVIVPSFREGKYAQGISAACKIMGEIVSGDEELVTHQGTAAEGESTSNYEHSESSSESDFVILFVMVLFFGVYFAAIIYGITHRGRKFRGGGFAPHNYTHFSSGHSSFSGGSHSGGFSGGGGSFGGGGASGHW